MTAATCWSDESRGVGVCERDDLRYVNWHGQARIACGKCKRYLGEAIGPATRGCEEASGYEEIPREWMV